MRILPRHKYAVTTIRQSYINEISTGNFRYLAANKLKNGIVHLSIEMMEQAQQNGSRCTQQDAIRLWQALIEVACKKDCGCAQNLHSHVSLHHLYHEVQGAEPSPLARLGGICPVLVPNEDRVRRWGATIDATKEESGEKSQGSESQDRGKLLDYDKQPGR